MEYTQEEFKKLESLLAKDDSLSELISNRAFEKLMEELNLSDEEYQDFDYESKPECEARYHELGIEEGIKWLREMDELSEEHMEIFNQLSEIGLESYYAYPTCGVVKHKKKD